MSGWIKIHRKLLDWEWYSDINCSVLFLHCLLLANFEDKKWRGSDVKRGSFISSLSNLSQSSGLTIQQVRTALSKLNSTSEITSKGHAEYTVFTVVKYNEYQDINTDNNKRSTRKQQGSNKLSTTTKEEEESKEDKNIYRSFAHLSITQQEYDKLLSEGYTKQEVDFIIDSVENYKKNINYVSLYLTTKKWLRDKYGTRNSEQPKDWARIREALPPSEIHIAKQLPDLLKTYCEQYGITENELLTLHDTK